MLLAARAAADDAADNLAPLLRELVEAIEAMADFRTGTEPPRVFQIPQWELEARLCDLPCNVTAAYLPREGIYLSDNLDPLREPADRAALLHELVHHLQYRQAKFAHLPACLRDRAEEQEAFALQNAYLAAIGRPERVRFHDDFDCDDPGDAQPR